MCQNNSRRCRQRIGRAHVRVGKHAILISAPWVLVRVLVPVPGVVVGVVVGPSRGWGRRRLLVADALGQGCTTNMNKCLPIQQQNKGGNAKRTSNGPSQQSVPLDAPGQLCAAWRLRKCTTTDKLKARHSADIRATTTFRVTTGLLGGSCRANDFIPSKSLTVQPLLSRGADTYPFLL